MGADTYLNRDQAYETKSDQSSGFDKKKIKKPNEALQRTAIAVAELGRYVYKG